MLSHGEDLQRRSRASDLADRDHVRIVPYVDVATVDADNFARLKSAIRGIKYRREVALYRNKDLPAAIGRIQQLLDVRRSAEHA